MTHFWLAHNTSDGVKVFIQPAYSLVDARVKAALAGYEEFTEAHQLDTETAMKIPKEMIGRTLTSKEAEELLKKMAQPGWIANLSKL
jgi:hypothetical protein